MNANLRSVQLSDLDRARGALLGLACGDAVGTTAEFMTRGSFPLLTDMVGGGPFELQAGQWTDDTSMALCLATSLNERGFDPQHQMELYLRWYEHGYFSSTGHCFDIGNVTCAALMAFKRTGNAFSGSLSPKSAGNGSIMRLASIPIRYLHDPDLALDLCEAQSRTTHQAPECLMACRLFGEVLIKALQGKSKEEVMTPSKQSLPMSAGLKSIAERHFKSKLVDEIVGSGYVVESLEAALWCFWNTNNFKDCVLLAANLGNDADTTAAICGQIAGAFYGEKGIPADWLSKLTMSEEIGSLAKILLTRKRPD